MRFKNLAKNIRIQKLQNKNHMVGQGLNVLGVNERRKKPWLGSYWFTEATQEQLKTRLEDWDLETEQMLKDNPNLKLT